MTKLPDLLGEAVLSVLVISQVPVCLLSLDKGARATRAWAKVRTLELERGQE